ncbi:hypothetical protein G5714_016543 [Onychostoma macrolepis]|uniref:Uncharacterized protein n=1 Tax=Onychostoma macrolepis TaxID=369639 RepID=A0A7J6C8S3_9TELE|nr:hypothetical protein G5714_016543 [Onychostoma macrolepis]
MQNLTSFFVLSLRIPPWTFNSSAARGSASLSRCARCNDSPPPLAGSTLSAIHRTVPTRENRGRQGPHTIQRDTAHLWKFSKWYILLRECAVLALAQPTNSTATYLLQNIKVSFKDVSVDLPHRGQHKHGLFFHLAAGTFCNYGGLNGGAFWGEGVFPLKVDGLLNGQYRICLL